MNSRMLGIALIVLGALGLIYDRFSYTKERHKADIGPISISVDEKETVRIPMWGGIAAIVVGIGLVLVPGKRTA